VVLLYLEVRKGALEGGKFHARLRNGGGLELSESSAAEAVCLGVRGGFYLFTMVRKVSPAVIFGISGDLNVNIGFERGEFVRSPGLEDVV